MNESMPAENLRSRKKRETRGRLVSVAHRLFAERGFDETTMEAIAEQAGVSRPTVFNYFASKQALLQEIASLADKRFAEQIEPLLNEPLSTAQRLEKAFVNMAARLQANPAITRVLAMQGFMSLKSEGGSAEHRFVHTERALTRLIKEGLRTGDVRSDYSVSLMSQMIMGAYSNVLILWLANPNYPVRSKLRQFARFFAEAVMPRESRAPDGAHHLDE